MKLTNENNLPLSLSLWLVNSSYDAKSSIQSKVLSATTLLKPTRALLLADYNSDALTEDVTAYAAAARGNSIHDAAEKALTINYMDNMVKLGLQPTHKINPKTFDSPVGCIFTEFRASTEIDGYTITGKFDLVMDGHLHDFKTTSTYSYISGSRTEDYIAQCSIYAYLNPDKVIDKTFTINYIFTNWSRAQAEADPSYPQTPVLACEYDLLSNSEVETLIKNKIKEINYYSKLDPSQYPLCSDKELWLDPPKYKCYASAEAKRATKVFDTAAEAAAYCTAKGSKYFFKEVLGQPKRCAYCSCANICTQYNLL